MLTVTLRDLTSGGEPQVLRFTSFGQMCCADMLGHVINNLGDRGYVDWIEDESGLEAPVPTRILTGALARDGYITHQACDLDEVIEYTIEGEV
jgi:hypothetical protein